jgi:hypothetical protein
MSVGKNIAIKFVDRKTLYYAILCMAVPARFFFGIFAGQVHCSTFFGFTNPGVARLEENKLYTFVYSLVHM